MLVFFVCALASKFEGDCPYFTSALYLIRVVWSIWQVRGLQHTLSDMAQSLRGYSGLNSV